MPETQRRPTLSSYTSGNSYFYAGVTIGVAVIIVGAILGSYKSSLFDRINKLEGQLQTSEDSRNKDNEKVVLDISKQSQLVRTLLGSKIYWSQALGYIEQMTQPQVRLITLNADAAKGTIDFQAAADTYAAVARQIASFTAGTGVNDISINNIQAKQQGSVEFSGTMKIDTKVMLNKAAK